MADWGRKVPRVFTRVSRPISVLLLPALHSSGRSRLTGISIVPFSSTPSLTLSYALHSSLRTWYNHTLGSGTLAMQQTHHFGVVHLQCSYSVSETR
jgi:hypothetical protein